MAAQMSNYISLFYALSHSSEGLFIPSLPSNLHHFLPYPHSQIMTFLLFHSENGSNWKIIYITPHKPYLSTRICAHICLIITSECSTHLRPTPPLVHQIFDYSKILLQYYSNCCISFSVSNHSYLHTYML